MHSKCGRYVIVLNGEIYNYRIIRQSLECYGDIQWRSHSDTEVLLEAISHWGVMDTLYKINGIFAIALWDKSEKCLFLIRDRLGEKPLYYGLMGKVFIFGSELKALRTHPVFYGEIDRDVLGLYFRNNYVPSPYSIYKKIFKLPQGCMLKLSFKNVSSGELPQPTKYWSLFDIAQYGINNLFSGIDEEAVYEVERYIILPKNWTPIFGG